MAFEMTVQVDVVGKYCYLRPLDFCPYVIEIHDPEEGYSAICGLFNNTICIGRDTATRCKECLQAEEQHIVRKEQDEEGTTRETV